MELSPAQINEGASPADNLAEVISAYNRITTKMQASHEALAAEFQRLQSELASANAALQRSKRLAALGQMAAGIAHEVRNPLASIRLYADMLVEDLSDRPEPCDTARKIAEAVRGLDGVVHDVLAYARPLEARIRTDDTDALFDRALHAAAGTLEQSDARVVCRIDPAARRLGVDAELMHRALLNLIRNAAEAMGGGGVLTLCADREGEAVVLTVADNGPGIGEEEIDRIFNPFFTTRATGTGLGLAIVHRIVDAHGGTIAVHNAPEGGAVFTITLPDRANEQDELA